MATSNHIIAGDTGYPELNDPLLGRKKLPAPPQGEDQEGRRISEVVCVALVTPAEDCIQPKAPNSPNRDGNLLFASYAGEAPETKPSRLISDGTWFVHFLDRPRIVESSPLTPRETLEEAAQNRPTWRFSLLQASFSFQESANNMSEKTRALLFTGFSAPGIYGANAHQWQISKRAELAHGGQWLDEYFRNQLDYASQVTEQIAPALPSISRTKNRDQFDAGLFLHPFTLCKTLIAWPCRNQQKEYPKIGFVFEPFRLDTPVAHEQLIIGPKSNQETVNMNRAQGLLARTGLRIENPKSHLEAGYEAGWERGSLVAFLSGNTSCLPLPAQSPYGCLTTLTPPVHIDQARETREQHGFYVDYSWITPLPFRNWQNIAQAQGDWYPFGPANDNSSDTRKLYDITEKSSIPSSPAEASNPVRRVFLYRNKFGVSAQGAGPSATLTWTFDRYSGGKLAKSVSWNPNPLPLGQVK